jgi:hypothetical protein
MVMVTGAFVPIVGRLNFSFGSFDLASGWAKNTNIDFSAL